MSVTIKESRDYLVNDILHVGDDNYHVDRLDMAIIAPCKRFLAETGCTLTSTTVALSEADEYFDPTHADTLISADFTEDWFVSAREALTRSPVHRVPLSTLQREYEASIAAGKPKYLAFEGKTKCWLSPALDDDYNLVFKHRAPLITWTPGTMGAWSASQAYKIGHVVSYSAAYYRCIQAHTNQTPAVGSYWEASAFASVQAPTTALNLPDDCVREVIATGGKHKLLHGSVKRKDAAEAGQLFEQVIARWRDKFAGVVAGEPDVNRRS